MNALFFHILIISCVVNHIFGDRTVEATLKLESPFGKPITNFTVSSSVGHCVTDDSGLCFLDVKPKSSFVLHGSAISDDSDYQDIWLYGKSPVADFKLTSYLGTRAEAKALGKAIDVPYNPSTGYMVVGLDSMKDPSQGNAPSNLVPAVGASAWIDGVKTGGAPFVYAPQPTPGHTVLENGSSFITFPNAVPGQSGIVTVSEPRKCPF